MVASLQVPHWLAADGRWVRPGGPETVLIPLGARMAGSTGMAVARIAQVEHARRVAHGLTAVTDLGVLDTCLSLPRDLPVDLGDLPPWQRAVVERAAVGVLNSHGGKVTRALDRPARVDAVFVEGRGWAPVLRRASRFLPVATTIACFQGRPRDLENRLWEAQLAGIGVWVREGDEVSEVLTPMPFEPGTFKAAGWRFEEHAYQGWLRQTSQSGARGVQAGHRSRPTSAASDQHQLKLPTG